jgi:hypothetical protein
MLLKSNLQIATSSNREALRVPQGPPREQIIKLALPIDIGIKSSNFQSRGIGKHIAHQHIFKLSNYQIRITSPHQRHRHRNYHHRNHQSHH